MTELIGLVGASLILIAFVMNQFKYWSSESLFYDLINLIGSGILIYYSWLLSSLPFMILNLVWFLVALKDLINYKKI